MCAFSTSTGPDVNADTTTVISYLLSLPAMAATHSQALQFSPCASPCKTLQSITRADFSWQALLCQQRGIQALRLYFLSTYGTSLVYIHSSNVLHVLSLLWLCRMGSYTQLP